MASFVPAQCRPPCSSGRMRRRVTFWFKTDLARRILAGDKTHTIRPIHQKAPKPGQIVSFSVGPRPPFAHAEILGVRTVSRDEISAEARLIYPQHELFHRIDFRVAAPPAQPASANPGVS